MSKQLFRDEALRYSQVHNSGRILISQPLSLHIAVAFVVLFIVALVLLLVSGQYTRKERVVGVTVPGVGTVRLVAPEAGVVMRSHVTEGQSVTMGQLLFEIGQDKRSDLGETQRLVETALEAQHQKIGKEMGLRAALATESGAALLRQADRLQSELQVLDLEIGLQSERLAVAKALMDKLRPLFDEHIVPEVQYQQQVSAYLEQRSRLEVLKRSRIGLGTQRVQILSQSKQESLRANSEEAALERSLLSNDQERFIRRAARMSRIIATVPGVAGVPLVVPGQSVEPGAPLVTLVPTGSPLDVHLFVPSSAIGFVRQGQKVRLRYDAFPYQKFGQHEGVVSSVSAVDASARDLLVRFPFLADKGAAFFQVRVRLASDHVRAYDQNIPLRPGLTLQADIGIESKSVISWIFDPLLALGQNR